MTSRQAPRRNAGDPSGNRLEGRCGRRSSLRTWVADDDAKRIVRINAGPDAGLGVGPRLLAVFRMDELDEFAGRPRGLGRVNVIYN